MKKIAIISDLPEGGGHEVFKSNYDILRKEFLVDCFIRHDSNLNYSGIIRYYKNVLSDLVYYYNLSSTLNSKYDLVIAYQSWLTKSPAIFPYLRMPVVYICNEVPREHYDEALRAKHNLKEKFVNNILLLPIKVIDYCNILLSKRNLHIVTISKLSKKLINKTYGIKAKVIYPTLPKGRYGEYKDYSKRKNQIVVVGAINKYKNQLYTLQVAANIERKNRPKVILIGNGIDKSYNDILIDYARSHDISLEIKVNITRPELIKIYNSSMSLLYSPINEPFGLVVLEAMRCGLPIIVNKQGGGFTEILSDLNGYTLKLDSKIWAKKYVYILNNKKKWKEFSEYNYSYVGKYLNIHSGHELINYINNLL